MNYNLLDDPWLPVLYRTGRFDRIGLIDAFKHAHDIRQVAASNPMDRIAILRLLLVLLYWCKGNPTKNAQNQMHESLPERWFATLKKNRNAFYLFGNEKRFFQYGHLDRKNLLSANSLIHEIPTGTNINHFRHSLDFDHGICPACCALGLIRLPLFTTQGGSGKAPGINFKPPIYIIPVGATLLETLRLSWVNRKNLGAPMWERSNLQIPIKGDITFLEGLTAMPRRVWLDNPDLDGTCMGCGRYAALVRRCNFAGIPKRKYPLKWIDPNVIYFTENNVIRLLRTENISSPGSLITDRPWSRMMEHILGSTYIDDQPIEVRFLIVGFSSDQTKYIDVWERYVVFPSGLNNEDKAETINRWSASVSVIPWKIKHPNRKPSIAERSLVRTIRPHIESVVSSDLSALLKWDENTWREATCQYGELMLSVSQSLHPGYATSSISRRKHTAHVLPDMKSKTAKNLDTDIEEELHDE